MTLSDALKALAMVRASLKVADGELVLDVPEGETVTEDVIDVLLDHRDTLIKQLQPSPKVVHNTDDGSLQIVKQTPPWDSALGFQTWDGQVLGQVIALDCETELIDKSSGPSFPALVLTAAWDGTDGYFIECEDLSRFLETNSHAQYITHNGPRFDVHVIDHHITPENPRRGPAHAMINENRLVDTMIMERLLDLYQYGDCKFIPNDPKYKLKTLVKKYTDGELDKESETRVTYGQYVGKSVSDMSEAHLEYAARDVIGTFGVYQAQCSLLPAIKARAKTAFGYKSAQHLEEMWATYGPMTMFNQVRTDAMCMVMECVGLHSDQDRIKVITEKLTQEMAHHELILNAAGIPTKAKDGKSNGKATAIREYLTQLEQNHGVKITRTDTGMISAAEQSLNKIAETVDDPVLNAITAYGKASKKISSYVQKWSKPHLHPRNNSLLSTGRISASGDVSTQNICRDTGKESPGEITVKQCLRSAPDHAFAGFDVAGAEIGTLAVAEVHQFGYDTTFLDYVESGLDIHMTVAHLSVGDRYGPVTKTERKMAKAVTFGIPGGLGPDALKDYAMNTFGVVMTDQDVVRVKAGYEKLNPGIKKYLSKTQANDLGKNLAKIFNLSSGNMGWIMYKEAKGTPQNLSSEIKNKAWKALEKLPELMSGPEAAKDSARDQIKDRKGDKELEWQLRKLSGMEIAMSMTGRLRGKCGFTQSRNNTFQSLAADAALYGLWKLYMAGYSPCAFIHDEIVVEIPLKDAHRGTIQHMIDITTKAMAEVLCGFQVTLEPFIRTSLSDRDDIDWEHSEELPPKDFFCTPTKVEDPTRVATPTIVDGQMMSFEVAQPKPRKRRDQANTQGRKQAKASTEFLF